MTSIRVSFVDVYVFRRRGARLQVLALRRAEGQKRPGSWEGVHGRIDEGETPVAAAIRELLEETGCQPDRFYNLSRVERFYLHTDDAVMLIPVFVAFVADDAEVKLSREHSEFVWVAPIEAQERFTWPRAARAIADAMRLLGTGDAGSVEDVLRIL